MRTPSTSRNRTTGSRRLGTLPRIAGGLLSDLVAAQVITFVTGNLNKLAVARQHLAPFGIEVEHVTMHLDEIQAQTVQEVALHKARAAFEVLRRPLIVEDSGFYIDE